ncbi:hypothetical protein AB0G74_14735 [Streptomyces sp. NPDC020875]|uniref:hypothetical protein n=1 Tax=Streptomyces sp. NPDC020875 TaxID=3154898 RepID=UPI0033D62580
MVVQRHGRRGGAVAVSAVVLGAIAVTGCAGRADQGGAAGPQVQPVADERPGTGDPVLTAAADGLLGAGSARTRTAMETAAGGTRVTIRGEGGYDFRRRTGRLTVVLPRDPAGAEEHLPVTELLTPGALYMKNRGAGVPADKWVRVDTTTLEDGNLVTGGATDPLAAAELLRGVREVAFLGRERIEGTELRHFRGTADIARAARIARPHARGALRAAAKGFTTVTVPFDAYVDDEGRLRKVRHRFSFSNGTTTVAVTSTTTLYDFGVPVTVRLPDPGDIYAGRIRS